MKTTISFEVACLITLAVYFAGCASPPGDSARSALLSLPFQQFDQTMNSGWRVYGDRGEHRKAAELIDAYLKQHNDLTVGQLAVLHFHAGTQRLLHGDTAAGLVHLNQAELPAKTPDNAEVWEGYSADWNEMVIATKAFVMRDRPALLAAKERVARLPSADVQWPDYPDFLLKYFGKPYGVWANEKAKK